MSDIQRFYAEKNVLITGATGFIGKALLEKLLFSCSGINKIYILIRNKNTTNKVDGISGKTRFEELLDSKVFCRLRSERPNDLKKVIPIAGDLTKPDLGMTEKDQIELTRKVNIVFHGAASIKFNEPLKVAVQNNLEGTRNVFDFFKKLKNQVAFVHLSTAYSHCHRSLIEEVVYPSPVDPNFILEASKVLNEDVMDSLTDHLLEGRPNTYVLSKAITESYLEQNCGDLPVAMVRPSIVTNAKDEPYPGWGDSKSALVGTSFLVGSGIIRNLPLERDARVDLVPVDFVTNLIIAVAWFTALKNASGETLPVYNMVSGPINPVTIGQYIDIFLQYGRDNRKTKISSYPYLNCTRNFVCLNLGIVLNHYLPSLILDLQSIFHGKKPRYFKFYRRFFSSSMPTTRYFWEHEFNFESKRVPELFLQMTEMDQKVFNFDVSSYEWNSYLTDMFPEIFDLYSTTSKKNMITSESRMKKLYIRFVAFNAFLCLSVTGMLFYAIGYFVLF